MVRWTIALFAVAGAFLVGNVAGAVVSEQLGLWYLPGAGFLAALGVVCVAYLAAPRKKLGFSALCFVLGAVLAWHLVGNEFYPASYKKMAYEPTLLPFAATCLGGLVGLLTSGAVEVWRRTRGAKGGDRMNRIKGILLLAILCALPSFAHAQGAGNKWETLNQEVMELYRQGRYDRAVVIARKALEVAEQNVGKNHPDVATSLENLAALYRSTKRESEALALERRAA